MVTPEIASASRMFGVTTAALGRRRARICFGSPVISFPPASASMTGSTTIGTSCLESTSTTASAVSTVASMPVFAHRMSMSDKTAFICATTILGGTLNISTTPRVFCAVIAVTTEVPCTPRAAKVRTSAWIPAPPPESDPAIVITASIYSGNALTLIYL